MSERRAKIAVSIDAKVLRSAERVRRKTGESRSALVNRALAELTRHDEEARRIADYVEAYRRFPETENELEAIDAAARRSLASVPWRDE